jgi:hypothetical protein
LEFKQLDLLLVEMVPLFYTATEEYNGTSWTAPGTLNTARDLVGAGTQTAAIGFGGGTPTVTGATELYNGTSWTTTTPMTTARQSLGGAGTQTAALAFGGNTGTVLQPQPKNLQLLITSTKKITTS